MKLLLRSRIYARWNEKSADGSARQKPPPAPSAIPRDGELFDADDEFGATCR